jgi:hypothetical protein
MNCDSFITSSLPDRTVNFGLSFVVAERPGDLKIPRIHGNLCRTFVDMRMRFGEPLPIRLPLVHCYSGFQAVFTETLPSK